MVRDAWCALFLSFVVVALYAPVREYGFITYDDPRYVGEENVRQGITSDGVKWAFTTTHFANWHPITWLSLMADAQLFGDWPGGHHFTSVVIHATNAVLLFLLLRTTTSLRWPSLVVAAIWALHPLRVESVAWAAERKDLLCGFFFLLSLLTYVRFARRRSWIAYAAMLLFYALGLMSKPMIVTMPFVLLLLDYWPLKRPVRAGLFVEKVPLLLMTLASCGVTYFAQRHGGAMGEAGYYPLPLRLANALWALGRYIFLTFWPTRLAVYYPYLGALPGTRLPVTGVLAGAALLIIVTAGGLLLWKRQRALLIGWLWFLGMLVPVIGLVQVGSQSMADRYTYLPQIGLIFAVVWCISSLVQDKPFFRRTALAVACLIAVALSILTHRQLKFWKDDLTLFTRALEVAPHNHTAHDMLGLMLSEKGDLDPAIEHYRRAIEIKPTAPNLHYNLARIYAMKGDYPQAQQRYERAIKLKPDYFDAILNLADVLRRQGHRPQAIEMYRRAASVDSDSYLAHYEQAVELAETGRMHEAIPEFEAAVKLLPKLPQAHYALGLALQEVGRKEDAIAAFRHAKVLAEAKQLEPLLSQINERLGKLSAATSKPASAPATSATFKNNDAGLPNPATNPDNPDRR